MIINKDLKKYIEEHIFPEYNKNDSGHDVNRVKHVIERSLRFAEQFEDINYDMVYTIAAYHDIGHHIDSKRHEILSAEYFEISLAEAVYDHRASSSKEPRSIYGKIVASADRVTRVEDALTMTYAYRVTNSPNSTLEEMIEDSRQHLIDKFGKDGYSNEKMYVEDLEFKKFIKDISELANNKEEFRRKYIEVNKIKED